MRGLNMEYYLPILVMVLIQTIYAGLTLGIRIVLLEGMSPMVFVVYRYAFATIVLTPIAYISGRNSGSYSLNLSSFSWIFITSLVGITLDQNLLAEGLYLVSSSVTSVMCNVVPAVTFVIAAFVGMEKGPKLLNAKNVVPPKSIIGTTLGSDEDWLLGCLILFGSCVAWSIWLILQVPAYASHPNSLSLSAWMCLMATLQSSAVTLFMKPDLNAWKINSLLQFGCILYSGVMGSAVALCLQAWCISRRGPVFSAMFTPVCTVIVTVLAALLLHEEIYIGSLIGGIGVIIGLYIVLWGKAEDVVDVKEKTIPKSMVNGTKEIVDKKSCGKAYYKSDLEEPLIS
ncbi:hypothetical protein P8452_73303 [Trifolium repens]|nr:hypothetical protein P8452_73303 [Trifolium repens]